MRWLLVVLALVLIGSASAAELCIDVEHESGRTVEIDCRTITCNDYGNVAFEQQIGTRADCRMLCSRVGDGHYTASARVSGDVFCPGPGDGRVPLPDGEPLGDLRFCVDAECSERVPYCDCTAPWIWTNASSDWTDEPVEVRAIVNDSFEPAGLRYRVENWTRLDCTDCTFSMGPEVCEGECRVELEGVDRSGNVVVDNITIRIDTTAPSLNATWRDPIMLEDRWYARLATLELSAVDNGSGVASLFVSEDCEEWVAKPGPRARFSISGSGETAPCIAAEDAAGNRYEARAEPVMIDAEAPKLDLGASSWSTQLPQFEARCTDDGSGCASISAWFSDDRRDCPADRSRYTLGFDKAVERVQAACTGECLVTICAFATDRVGLDGSREIRTIGIDRTDPVVELDVPGELERDASVDVMVVDDSSVRCAVRVGDRTLTEQSCDGNTTISARITRRDCPLSRSCTLSLSATDAAGNTARIERSFSIAPSGPFASLESFIARFFDGLRE